MDTDGGPLEPQDSFYRVTEKDLAGSPGDLQPLSGYAALEDAQGTYRFVYQSISTVTAQAGRPRGVPGIVALPALPATAWYATARCSSTPRSNVSSSPVTTVHCSSTEIPVPPQAGAVAMHQPNLLPRLSTLAKLYAADRVIVLDDVQFARQDYQHRARLASLADLDRQQWLSISTHLLTGRRRCFPTRASSSLRGAVDGCLNWFARGRRIRVRPSTRMT